jgi:hypothetical protein
MPIGRPLVPVALTTADRTTLEQWTRRRATAQALALRARIILRAVRPRGNRAIEYPHHPRVARDEGHRREVPIAVRPRWPGKAFSMSRGQACRAGSPTRTSSR